jgi:thioredoxin-like negative regulator of GroEL
VRAWRAAADCERLKPVWAELAGALRGAVAVARVDGPAQRALSARLSVRSYPTILLLREGTMREYDGGARNVAALRAWATSGYAASPKAPLLRTPNNALGRVLGAVFRVPSATARARDAAKAALGVGDAALAALAVAAALAATVLGIVALDCALTFSARPHQA